MQITETKRKIRVKEWTGLIQEQQQSCLTVRAWCQIKGISEGQYYYWLRVVREAMLDEVEKHNGRDTSIQLVEVHDRTPSVASSEEQAYSHASCKESCIRIQYGQATIELPASTNLSVVAALVKALSQP